MEQQLPKLYLSMILKEDEPVEMVKRSIDSVRSYVDDLYITVTYKESKPFIAPLVTLLKDTYHANVSYFKWTNDFSEARNFAMNQVPKGEHTYIYWHDADDILQNPEKLPRVLLEMDQMKAASIFFNYLYMVELNERGQIHEVLIEHKRERLIRNDDTFKWIGALHETLIEQRQENIQKYYRDDCVVIHLSDPKRFDASLERNVLILEEQARKEQHKDPRTLIYLAKAYFDKTKIVRDDNQRKIYADLAFNLFMEYLKGSGTPGTEGYREGSGWAEERATAWSYMAELYRMYGNVDEALHAIDRALAEAPQFPSYYIDKAALYVLKQDIAKAKIWLMLATNIEEPNTTILLTPRDLKAKALEVDYHISLAEGKLEKAKKDIELLLQIFPNHPDFMTRFTTVNSMEAANKAAQSVVYLGKYLEDIKEAEKLPDLIRAIPRDLQIEKFASEMRHRFMPTRTWENNEIAILCGPGWEPWSPKDIETGLGGSEEAIVYLSRELVKKGYKVTVYANPMLHAGVYEGVEYKMWYDLNPQDNFNILIIWRAIGFVDVNPKAKLIMLWLHDVPNNPDFTQARLEKIDKIAVLSEYHRSLLRQQLSDSTFAPIPDEKILITSNGIEIPEIPQRGKNQYSMIYVSSPDRGLTYLLNNWKKIREQVPQVTLDIYYGFNIFDKMFANNPGRQQWKQWMIEQMNQPGITYHARVGHRELEKAFANAALWAYPTDFTEISCISAMKAQALGAVPVVTDFAALKETVKNGLKVQVDIRTPEGQEEYIKALVSLLKDKNQQEDIRKTMMPWAQEYFKWEHVAVNWNALFKQKIS